MREQLGKLNYLDWVEKRGNPVTNPIVQGYWSFVQETTASRVGVKQEHLRWWQFCCVVLCEI